MPRDQEEVDRLKKFDVIRTEILKDYRRNISSRNQNIPLSRLYIRLITSTKYIYSLFEVFLRGEEDFSVSLFLYPFRDFTITKFFMFTFFSEEERAHYSDLRMEWLKPPYNRYRIWWKIFDHLFLQKFFVAPIFSVCNLCAKTVMYIFGSFK